MHALQRRIVSAVLALIATPAIAGCGSGDVPSITVRFALPDAPSWGLMR